MQQSRLTKNRYSFLAESVDDNVVSSELFEQLSTKTVLMWVRISRGSVERRYDRTNEQSLTLDHILEFIKGALCNTGNEISRQNIATVNSTSSHSARHKNSRYGIAHVRTSERSSSLTHHCQQRGWSPGRQHSQKRQGELRRV